MCLDIAQIPARGYLITSTQATVYKNEHPIIIHCWCDLGFSLVQFCYVCFIVLVCSYASCSRLRTTTISFVTISFIFYAIFIPVFYQFSVNSCEEVLKKNMEKRPASFELLAGNLRYNVSVDPSFLFQNKYESLLQLLSPRENNFCCFFFSWFVCLFVFLLLFCFLFRCC